MDNTFTLKAPSGRVYELRPLPKHFFIFYGEFPSALTEAAAIAILDDKPESFADTVGAIPPEQLKKLFVFIREAVKFVCVKPKISLDPQNADEISPAEIPDQDFDFISAWAMKSVGGAEAEGLEIFRAKSAKTAPNRAGGKALQRKAK